MISFVVAMDQLGTIGMSNGDMPWGRTMKADLKHFRNLTFGNTVVMGRKTFDTIGERLPNRRNIVISRNKNLEIPNCEVVHSWDEVQSLIAKDEQVFVIGGKEIYLLALPYVERIHQTVIDAQFSGSVTLPELLPEVLSHSGDWVMRNKVGYGIDLANPFSFSFITWERKIRTQESFVVVERGRTEEHKAVLEKIQQTGECPFCKANLLKYHTKPIVFENVYWVITTNFSPYTNTRFHFLFISQTHAEKIGDLSNEAGAALWAAVTKIEQDYHIDSGSIFIRFGDPRFNGGSVRHLHVHVIVPDLDSEWETPSIKVKLGSKK